MPIPCYTDEPPLNSDCRWYCIDVLTGQLIERLCSGDDAVLDLYEALCLGHLHCMVRTGPARERRLLTCEDWAALRTAWRNTDAGWYVEVTYCETGEPFPASFYIWKPGFDALWPCGLDVPPPLEQLTASENGTGAQSSDGRERPEWKAFLVPLLEIMREGNQLPDKNAAVRAVDACLSGKGLTMVNSAIYAGLKRHCKDWWPD